MNPDEPFCFLITSFSDDTKFQRIRRVGIDPAARTFGFPVYRIDEIPFTSSIIDATREYITLADFVIADLTGSRPNCYYEVGYAHAIGRPIVHIINETETPAFNVADLTIVKYRDPLSLQRRLRRHLLTHILTCQGVSDVDDDPHRGKFGRRQFVDDFIITGRVRVKEGDENDATLSFMVDLKVRSVNPGRPLRGAVTFHLHPDFDEPTLRAEAKNGVAELQNVIESNGSFVVGAELHETNTMLELDLARVPGAGAEFRER